jgi:hypothetical protein
MVRLFLHGDEVTSSAIREELTSQPPVHHQSTTSLPPPPPSHFAAVSSAPTRRSTKCDASPRLAAPTHVGTLRSPPHYARTGGGVAVPCHASAVAGRQRPHHAPRFFDPPPPPPPPLLLPSMSRLDSFPSVRFGRRLHLRPVPYPLAPIPWNPDSAPTCRRPPAPLAFTSPLSLSCGRGWWVGAFLVIENKKIKCFLSAPRRFLLCCLLGCKRTRSGVGIRGRGGPSWDRRPR